MTRHYHHIYGWVEHNDPPDRSPHDPLALRAGFRVLGSAERAMVYARRRAAGQTSLEAWRGLRFVGESTDMERVRKGETR